jgi:hypothetical protein
VSRAFREAVEAGRPEFLGATFGAIRLNGALLARLDRAVHVHRRTCTLLRRAGIADTDGHDRRALRLRAAWYRRHALRSLRRAVRRPGRTRR